MFGGERAKLGQERSDADGNGVFLGQSNSSGALRTLSTPQAIWEEDFAKTLAADFIAALP